MNLLLQMPLVVRQGLIFALGLALGSFVNWGIYALAWHARPISPWSKPPAGAPPRHWSHYVPVAGWWLRRGESELFGRGFWIRPMLLELALGAGLALLYGWEVSGQLLPLPVLAAGVQGQLHAEFLAHAILILLMMVGTFIDFDEQTIPDSITIPGTILGLLLAASLPVSLLPVVTVFPPPPTVGTLMLSSPLAWPAWLDGPRGLMIGCAIFLGWCLALIPATCTMRRGLLKGVQFYLASAVRGCEWWRLLLLAAVGCGAIAVVWSIGGPRWQSMLTALTGLAFGGLLVWSVRIVGQAALHKEAMGFGDVTLMAMIGSFLGWQTSLVVFFLSPAAALFIALTQWILTGRRDIAFGPYLCLAAVFAIVCWPAVWGRVGGVFAMGLLVPALFGACLLLMMGMLMFWRFAEELMTREPPRRR